MRGKTHAAAGVLSGAVLALVSGWNPAVCACAAVAGSLAPDVDTFRSPAARQMRRVRRGLAGAAVATCVLGARPEAMLHAIGLDGAAHTLIQSRVVDQAASGIPAVWSGQIVGLVLCFLLMVAGSLCSHRGATHSLVMLGLLSVTLGAFLPQCGVAFGLGYATHLVLDMLNYQKVPLLWPLKSAGSVSFGVGKSGGKLDSLLFVALVGAAVAAFGMLALGHS